MRPNVSKFKIWEESARDFQMVDNFVDENVLLSTLRWGKPWADLTGAVMDYVSTSMPSLTGKSTPFSDFLEGSGRVEKVDSEYITWKLKGTGELNAVSLENLNETIVAPGLQGGDINIKLDVEWYVEGDIIAPIAAKEYQLVIQADPESDGSGYVYNCKLVDRNLNNYYPPELLQSNLQWMKISTAFGEASSKYGSFKMGGMSFIQFMVDMTSSGNKVKVTDKANETMIRMSSCGEDGMPIPGYPDQIISKLEAEFIANNRWERELALYYGRSMGRHVIDSSSGTHRRHGPGLLEFMEDGNVFKYPVGGGSIEMLQDFFNSVWFDRVNYNNRNVTLYTGQGGLTLLNDWITKKYAESAVPSKFEAFTGPAKSFDPKNYQGLSYGNGFFTEIKMFPFGSIKVEHWPILDNMYVNGGSLHPVTGIPMSSYNFFALDYGIGNGISGSNISLLQRTNPMEVYTHLCGTWSPAGAIKQGGRYVATHPGRFYELLWADTYGVRVKDITLTAWFKPAVTY